LDRLEARGCAPIRRITFDVGPVRIAGIGPAVGEVTATYCPRRTVLDALLVEAATAAGAELLDKFVVRDLLIADDQVVGVRGGPAATQLRARVVVGADGVNSTVARKLGARSYRQVPARTAVYYSYWAGLDQLGASFHARTGQLILVWPTNDRLTCVYVAWPRAQFHRVRTDVAGCFHSALGAVPHLQDAVASSRQAARFVGTGNLANFYRTSAGPGWALVGDAGHHKDPATGMGMSDAFLSAELLAAAIDDGLTGRRAMAASLLGYQQRRDALTAAGFELALSTARLAPLSTRMAGFYRSAAGRPELAEKVFGVLGGSLSASEVFAQVTA
jgi:flavin-dependent dehydrogenase